MYLQFLNRIPPWGKTILIRVPSMPLLYRDLESSLYSSVVHLFVFHIWHDQRFFNHFSRGFPCDNTWQDHWRLVSQRLLAPVHPALWSDLVFPSKQDKCNSFSTCPFFTFHNSFSSSLHEEALMPRWFLNWTYDSLTEVLSTWRSRLMCKSWDSIWKIRVTCSPLLWWDPERMVSCSYELYWWLITEKKC